MQVYKFRILHDDTEDFYRDVEILSGQTFEDFRQIIHRCVDMPTNELSSFYQCSASWEKLREITLMDMSEEENPIETMENAILQDYIETPNQRFVYEYDFLNPASFFIQLIETLKDEQSRSLPCCAGGEGILKLRKTGDITAGIDYEMIDEFDELLRGDAVEPESDYYADFDN